MFLTPPEHFKGRLHPWAPLDLRQARKQWIVDQATQGATHKQISEALEVSTATVWKHLRQADFKWWEHQDARKEIRTTQQEVV